MARSNPSGGGFFSDFQKFIMRGNVVDLAIAVILGGAFGKIIESLVTDIITPAILNPAMKAAGVERLAELSLNGIQYGLFLAAILNFLVIGLCLFALIRALEAAQRRIARKKEMESVELPPPPEVVARERLINALENLAQTIESNNKS